MSWLLVSRAPVLQRVPTSAGDSAAYERRSSSADDVVIVSALRTPICRVRMGQLALHYKFATGMIQLEIFP